jgi:hypothetical protein
MFSNETDSTSGRSKVLTMFEASINVIEKSMQSSRTTDCNREKQGRLYRIGATLRRVKVAIRVDHGASLTITLGDMTSQTYQLLCSYILLVF